MQNFDNQTNCKSVQQKTNNKVEHNVHTHLKKHTKQCDVTAHRRHMNGRSSSHVSSIHTSTMLDQHICALLVAIGRLYR